MVYLYAYMDGFLAILKDFKHDLSLTFPELVTRLNDLPDALAYEHCCKVIPNFFFDILYEKESLFDEERFFMPDINFSVLMKDPAISDKTKKTLWKYLQLILFYTVEKTALDDGDTQKMEKTMAEMKNMFTQSDVSNTFQNMFKDISNDDFLNSDTMKEHMDKMMNGKIGSIAKEIASEAAEEFQTSPEDFMKQLMQDPTKMMGLVQSIGSKLESKLKSHDLNQSDMMKEATDLMDQMKDMPGLKEMMGKMGMYDKKMDMKAMARKMDEATKSNATRERLRKKMENNAKAPVLEQTEKGAFVFKPDGAEPKRSNRRNRKKNKKDKKE